MPIRPPHSRGHSRAQGGGGNLKGPYLASRFLQSTHVCYAVFDGTEVVESDQSTGWVSEIPHSSFLIPHSTHSSL